MESINWSLSAIDKIFPLRKGAKPVCPNGTFAAGYTRDAWNNWQVLCLEVLSVEDVEDLFIFGFLIVGFLFLALGIALTYRKICKTAASKFTQPLSVEIKGCFGDVCDRLKVLDQRLTQIDELNRNISARTVEVQKKIDTIGGQTGELLRIMTGLSMKLDEMPLHEPDTRQEG